MAQCSSCHKYKEEGAFIHPTSGKVGKTCADCIVRKSSSTKAGAAAEVEAVLLDHARKISSVAERLADLERAFHASQQAAPVPAALAAPDAGPGPRLSSCSSMMMIGDANRSSHTSIGGQQPPNSAPRRADSWSAQADYLEQMLLADPQLCRGFSPCADLAEWFPLRDETEPVRKGDLVEMRDRHISREITGEGVLFVVTTAPFFVGNAPPSVDDFESKGRAVVMIGQAPVNVAGAVAANQCLEPSGRHDGTAVATDEPSGIIAMQDWDPVTNQVNCLVNAGSFVSRGKGLLHAAKTRSSSAPPPPRKDDDDKESSSKDSSVVLTADSPSAAFLGTAVEAATKINRAATTVSAFARVFIASRRRAKLVRSARELQTVARGLNARQRAVRRRGAVITLQRAARGYVARTAKNTPGAVVAELRRLRRQVVLLLEGGGGPRGSTSPSKNKSKTTSQQSKQSKLNIRVERAVAVAEAVEGVADCVRLAYTDPELPDDDDDVTFAVQSFDGFSLARPVPTSMNHSLRETVLSKADLDGADLVALTAGAGHVRYTWKASALRALEEGRAARNAGRAHGRAAKYFVAASRGSSSFAAAANDGNNPCDENENDDEHTVEEKIARVVTAVEAGASVSRDLARLLSRVAVELKPDAVADDEYSLLAAEPALILDHTQDKGLFTVKCKCARKKDATGAAFDCVTSVRGTDMRLLLDD